MAKFEGDARLAIHFNMKRRIEISELACSFKAISSLYREFLLEREKEHDTSSNSKLFIATIKDNCIDVQVAQDIINTTDPAVLEAQINIFRDFMGSIKTMIASCMDASDNFSDEPSISGGEAKTILDLFKAIKDIKEIVDKGFIIRVRKNNKDDSKPPIKLSSDDVKKVIKGAENIVKSSGKTKDKKHKKIVSLRFTKVNTSRPEDKGQGGFKGIIKDIDENEHSIRVPKAITKEIKELMRDGKLNPSKDSCDVEVLKGFKNGELKSYKIEKLHGVIRNSNP